MNIRKVVERILPPVAAFRDYLRERRPYSRGYMIYVQRLVVGTLNDRGLVESFRRGAPLPDSIGVPFHSNLTAPWLREPSRVFVSSSSREIPVDCLP